MEFSKASLADVERPGAYDAIVVGAGATGGLAAEQLTEAGLRTLVLDAGWRENWLNAPIDRSLSAAIRFVANPSFTRVVPARVIWKARQGLRLLGKWRRPIQSQCYAWESAPDSFVDDFDNPYETPLDQPYRWIRARQIGGRMLVPAHGKQYYRHSRFDFAPTDGLSPPWPIDIDELETWYDEVETKLELFGRCEGSEFIPDSTITNPLHPNDLQRFLIDRVSKQWPMAQPILGRFAPPRQSLVAASATNLLSVRSGAVAFAVTMDSNGTTTGIKFHDRETDRKINARAPLVFLCASAFETTRILLISAKESGQAWRPSDALGRYIMDHVSIKLEGVIPHEINRSVRMEAHDCVYLPRFDLRDKTTRHERGYGVRLYLFPGPPGSTNFTAVSDSELLPNTENHVSLSNKMDRWGVPILRISCRRFDEEERIVKGQRRAMQELAEAFDVRYNGSTLQASDPGASIHEVGGARMGSSPEQSVLDPHNRPWGVSGLYVTDGAAFPSIGNQNPTLTMMALTARACHHAIYNNV